MSFIKSKYFSKDLNSDYEIINIFNFKMYFFLIVTVK